MCIDLGHLPELREDRQDKSAGPRAPRRKTLGVVSAKQHADIQQHNT